MVVIKQDNQISKIINSIKEFFNRAFTALKNIISNFDMSQMERNTSRLWKGCR